MWDGWGGGRTHGRTLGNRYTEGGGSSNKRWW